jgi:hypothetical protein
LVTVLGAWAALETDFHLTFGAEDVDCKAEKLA